MGVSGRPVPTTTVRHHGPLLEQPAGPAGHQRSAAQAFAAGVLGLQVEQVALIESGKRTLGMQVEPVLRDGQRGRCGLVVVDCPAEPDIRLSSCALAAGGDVTLAAEAGVIVDRFRISVEQRRGEAAAQPAAQLKLARFARGVTTRSSDRQIPTGSGQGLAAPIG